MVDAIVKVQEGRAVVVPFGADLIKGSLAAVSEAADRAEEAAAGAAAAVAGVPAALEGKADKVFFDAEVVSRQAADSALAESLWGLSTATAASLEGKADKQSIFHITRAGAVNGAASCRAAVVQAMTDAANAGGGIVYFPAAASRWNLGLEGVPIDVPPGVVLDFDRRASTILSLQGDQDIFRFGIGATAKANAIRNLSFNAASMTGGRVIYIDRAERMEISVQSGENPYNFLFAQSFNVLKVNGWIGAVRGSYAIKAYGDATHRSDILSIGDLTVSSTAGQADGLVVDGNVNTIDIGVFRSVKPNRGVMLTNTAGAGVPRFFTAANLEVDFPLLECIRNEACDDVRIANLYAHGSYGSDNIYVGPGLNRGMRISQAKISSAYKANIRAFSDVEITAGDLIDASQQGLNLFGGVELESGATARINGGRITGSLQSYAVVNKAGSLGADISANTALSGATGAVNDIAGTVRIGASLNKAQTFSATQTGSRWALDANAYWTLSSGRPTYNLDAADYFDFNRATNTFALSIGGATAFSATATNLTAPRFSADGAAYFTVSGTDVFLNWDGSDYLGYDRTSNAMRHVVGGVTILTSSATGLNLNSGSLSVAGSVVIDSNRLVKLRSYTVATLPTTGGAGATAMASDALTPAFGATVVGGGAVLIPVYYDGTNWKVG